jgi:hypothetical protein
MGLILLPVSLESFSDRTLYFILVSHILSNFGDINSSKHHIMNKKLIIGALVGGLILFIWQFLSWALLDLHSSSMTYTSQQDQILAALEGLDEGTYYLPRMAMDAPADAQQTFMENQVGKPWASVTYHKAMEMSMGMNMIRGFAADFLALLLLCWVLMKIDPIDFKTALLSTLAVGFIGYITIHYTDSIWFEANTIPDLIDTIIQWGLCGAWLGFFLPRA